MNLFQSLIAISLSPNTERDDVWLACKTICSPWMWHKSDARERLRTWFETTFDVDRVCLYNSGRSALFEILKAFGVGSGDEVIVQAFTCVAVPNSVIWTGATPIYCDIDETYNIDPQSLKRLITKKTKAIIVQHTFGIPGAIEEIVKIAKEHNLFLIEDCAHALGASYKGKLLGTWGDAAIFSFGRDKVISSVFGGVGFISPKHPHALSLLRLSEKKLPFPRWKWTVKQLLHPLAFFFILPVYRIGIGKLLLVILQRLNLLSFPVYPEEKYGEKPDDFPMQYPEPLARLAYQQLGKLARYNKNRQQSANLYRMKSKDSTIGLFPPYSDGAIYLRLPLRVDNAEEVLKQAKKKGILLGNWYHHVIDPDGVDFQKIGYIPGSCSRAEEMARHVVNLPTRISEPQAQRIIHFLRNFAK